jgi:hypothetical protein
VDECFKKGFFASITRRVAARFASANYFKHKPVKLNSDADEEWISWLEDGEFWRESFELVPVRLVDINEWNPHKTEKVISDISEGKPLDPVILTFSGSRYKVTDGNHRAAASARLGFSYVPAVVSTLVKTRPTGKMSNSFAMEVLAKEASRLTIALGDKCRRITEWGVPYFEASQVGSDGYSIKIAFDESRKTGAVSVFTNDGSRAVVLEIAGKTLKKLKVPVSGIMLEGGVISSLVSELDKSLTEEINRGSGIKFASETSGCRDYGKIIREFEKALPEHIVSEIGRTDAGTTFLFEAPDTGKKKILMVSGQHGEEIAAPWALLELFRKYPHVTGLADISVVPVCNVHGFKTGERDGVGGFKTNWVLEQGRVLDTLSQEVQVLVDNAELLAELGKDGLLNMHEDIASDGVYAYLFGAGRCIAGQVVSAVAAHLPKRNDGRYDDNDGYTVTNGIVDNHEDGSFDQYMVEERGVRIAITTETPAKADIEKRVAAGRDMALAFVKEVTKFIYN